MTLGFTGTQRGQTQRQRATVRGLFTELKVTELHHGDCIGSDAQADLDAKRVGANIVIHPPSDDKKRAFCDYSLPVVSREPKSYLERNRDIVDEGIDGLIATPKEASEVRRSGTWATVRYARSVGRRIWIVFPDGTFREEMPPCLQCGKNTAGFDEDGPLCIDCTIVKALKGATS